MKHRVRIFPALLMLALSPSTIAFPQSGLEKPKKNEAAKTDKKENNLAASVKIKIHAEGRSALPSGSKIQWDGIGERCRNVTGEKNLQSTGETLVSLPACKVKLTVFITGFDTKAVTVDLVGNEKKYADPIHITVKHQGPAEVDW